jgi:hypothetical protein
MFLRDLLPHYGIPSIAELRRFHGEVGIPVDALLQVERAEPAKRRGRKPLRTRAKGRPSTPPPEDA